jgi:hypothetical protein
VSGALDPRPRKEQADIHANQSYQISALLAFDRQQRRSRFASIVAFFGVITVGKLVGIPNGDFPELVTHMDSRD